MTSPLYGSEPEGSADDAALDALLFASDEAVGRKLEDAVDLDEGRARIFAASVSPDQEPIPYSLRTAVDSNPPEQQPLVPAFCQRSGQEVHSDTHEEMTGSPEVVRPEIAPQHDRARSDGESITRPQTK